MPPLVAIAGRRFLCRLIKRLRKVFVLADVKVAILGSLGRKQELRGTLVKL
jgi:hypothetical protein